MANWGEKFSAYHNLNNEDNNVHPINSAGVYRNPHPNAFSTDMVFSSRQQLTKWVRNITSSLGFIIVIKRNRRDLDGDEYEVVFQCDCGVKNLGDDYWNLIVNCEEHNHEFALHLEGKAYARRLFETQDQLVEDLSANNVKPRDILSTIKQQYPNNVSTSKTIYNQCQKIRPKKNAGRTPIQVLMSFLQEEGCVFYDRANDSTNELEDLFIAHLRSLEIWRAFPHVLLMDATYQTNMFDMPLLEIVSVTSTNKTFSIAFVLMHKEKISNYTWALNCLLSLTEEYLFLRVIVTGKVLKNALWWRHNAP
ncbi:hypothetical protein OSB04_006206 [Centaurea solstitialis]|uniref:MULE transposase domain-containing protein n=1 Tax=Centaurea solstitialis TaxID=347529 RepID=A0AA38TVA6_9ASTR|nr:hypothetical protein OSB04_006206 [Centaurea solstitialis]